MSLFIFCHPDTETIREALRTKIPPEGYVMAAHMYTEESRTDIAFIPKFFKFLKKKSFDTIWFRRIN